MKTALPKTSQIAQAIRSVDPFARFRARGGTQLVSAQPSSAFAESFRLLALNLRVLLAENQNKAVAIISPFAGDGRSCVAANLAVTLGETDHTLLVDGLPGDDSSLRAMMMMEHRNGVEAPAAVPVGTLSTGHHSVWLLPGTVARVRHTPGALQEAAAKASAAGIYTIVDTPPAARSSAAFSLAREVGQAIYILGPNAPDMEVHRRIKEQLERLGVRILGLVLNEA